MRREPRIAQVRIRRDLPILVRYPTDVAGSAVGPHVLHDSAPPVLPTYNSHRRHDAIVMRRHAAAWRHILMTRAYDALLLARVDDNGLRHTVLGAAHQSTAGVQGKGSGLPEKDSPVAGSIHAIGIDPVNEIVGDSFDIRIVHSTMDKFISK